MPRWPEAKSPPEVGSPTRGQTPSPRALQRAQAPRTLTLMEGDREAGTSELSLLWCECGRAQQVTPRGSYGPDVSKPILTHSPCLWSCLPAFRALA